MDKMNFEAFICKFRWKDKASINEDRYVDFLDPNLVDCCLKLMEEHDIKKNGDRICLVVIKFPVYFEAITRFK